MFSTAGEISLSQSGEISRWSSAQPPWEMMMLWTRFLAEKNEIRGTGVWNITKAAYITESLQEFIVSSLLISVYCFLSVHRARLCARHWECGQVQAHLPRISGWAPLLSSQAWGKKKGNICCLLSRCRSCAKSFICIISLNLKASIQRGK